MQVYKRLGGLVLAVGLLVCLTGCQPAAPGEVTPPPSISDTDDDSFDQRTELAKVIDFKQDDGMMLAVAYLGYGEQTANETLEVMAPQYSPDGKDLLQGLDLIDYGGDEFYLIVPRFASMEVTVEQLSMSDEAEPNVEDTQVRDSAEPFLLRCNPSDIFPSSRITLKAGDWSGSYSPAISLKDGGLVPDEFILDITDYVPATANQEAKQ